jgi:hypothetical protein
MMAKTSADGWDRDEREALKGLEAELDSLRARHARDPEIELLCAADAEVLPDDLQSAGAKFLAEDRWSRTLVEGLQDESIALDRQDESRLLDRIRREAGASASSGASRSWFWPSLVAAAAGIIAVVWVMRPGVTPGPTLPTNPPVAVATPSSAPVYAMALDKPEVTLSVGALTWRHAGRQGDLLADLKPGLDAFRGADYATARRELSALTTNYPNAIEVFLYLGVSQLHLGEHQAALDSLKTARGMADTAGPTLGVEAAWYEAMAHERLGHKDDARIILNALCVGTSARTQAACAAAAALK